MEVGQSIITSGLAGDLEAGLLIGEIEEVIASDPQIFQQAKIKPAANLDDIENVFVIIDG